GRTDIPVVPGALFPLVRRREAAQLWQQRFGKVAYAGAWDDRWFHKPSVIPPLREGQPSTKASTQDAAHFMIRMVHRYPHQVSIFAGGPMTRTSRSLQKNSCSWAEVSLPRRPATLSSPTIRAMNLTFGSIPRQPTLFCKLPGRRSPVPRPTSPLKLG